MGRPISFGSSLVCNLHLAFVFISVCGFVVFCSGNSCLVLVLPLWNDFSGLFSGVLSVCCIEGVEIVLKCSDSCLLGEFLRQVNDFEISQDLFLSTRKIGFVVDDKYLFAVMSCVHWNQRNLSLSHFSAIFYKYKATHVILYLAADFPKLFSLGFLFSVSADQIFICFVFNFCYLIITGWVTNLDPFLFCLGLCKFLLSLS